MVVFSLDPCELPIWNQLQRTDGAVYAAHPPSLMMEAQNEVDVLKAMHHAATSPGLMVR